MGWYDVCFHCIGGGVGVSSWVWEVIKRFNVGVLSANVDKN